MKNQYFGDVRDYLKYSLLRSLGRELSVAVCWLLTEDDLSADGRIVSYLEKPDRWRAFDPLVYDFLRLKVLEEKQRRVDVLHKAALLGDNCRLFSETVPVDDLERCRYFDRFMEYADGTGLTFFDPDTGIEPASTKGPKYVHWHELDRAFRQGHSLLIYQHFARGGKHDPFVEGKAEQLARLPNADEILVFHDHSVALFLVPQPEHAERLRRAKRKFEAKWKGRITVRAFTQPSSEPNSTPTSQTA